MSSASPAFETDSHAYEAVPEPGTWILFGVGLGLVVAARAKFKR
jgi:hypothetical protein